MTATAPRCNRLAWGKLGMVPMGSGDRRVRASTALCFAGVAHSTARFAAVLIALAAGAARAHPSYGVNSDYWFYSPCINFHGGHPNNGWCAGYFYGYPALQDYWKNRAGDVQAQPDGPGGWRPDPVRADCNWDDTRFKCAACDVGYEHRNPMAGNWWDRDPFPCVQCRTGRYQNEVAGGGRKYYSSGPDPRYCKACPEGRFQNERGATACKLCPGGRYSNSLGNTGCSYCQPGRANTHTGQTSCEPCPEGQYTHYSGAWYCYSCPNGKWTYSTGADHVSDCVDADECAADWPGTTCDHYCDNAPQFSFTCTCAPGYDKQGVECVPRTPYNMVVNFRAVRSESDRCPTCYDAAMHYDHTFTLPSGLAGSTTMDSDLYLTEFGNTAEVPVTETRDVPGNVVTGTVQPQTHMEGRARWKQVVHGTVAQRHEVSPWVPVSGIWDFGLAPCGCRTPAEASGKPSDLRVTQHSAGADIYFLIGWTDSSLCETSFLITRMIDDQEVTIGSYPSANQAVSAGACGRTYDPDVPETRDSISDAVNDPPGTTRTYCVTATGLEYESETTCQSVQIAWYAVISVSVRTLRQSGVYGVNLDWEILGGNANGTVPAATRSDGSYALEIQVPDLNVTQATVRLTPSKMTGNTSHSFEYENLPATYVDVDIGHLDTVSVSLIDTSGFAAEGRILMDDVLGLGLSCGSEGVEVCAIPTTPGAEPPECDTTDADGNFEVPIVIGASFQIVPTLGNHTFESAQDSTGVHTIINVQADELLVDFTDTSTSEATVVVAGGLCNLDIGRASIEFRSQSGCLVHTVWQDDWRHTYTMPSMDMTIAVLQVDAVDGVSGDDARAYLERVSMQRQRADLQVLPAATREFIYHPRPTISMTSPAAFRGDCDNFRVMKSQYGYVMRVQVSQDFGAAGVCHDVTGNVTLQDNLLETAECATGCVLPLQQEIAEIYGQGPVVQASTVVKKVIAGPPNLFAPHTLSVQATFSYAGQDAVTALEDFFVEGEVLLGESFSVDFPRGLPIMVLHDPPGLGSWTEITDVTESVTSISVSSSQEESLGGSLKVHAGIEASAESCVGAIAAYYCEEVVSVTASVYGQADVSGVRAEEEEYGMDFNVVSAQGYSTAGGDLGENDHPGRDSTMILSTSLNIKFSKVDRVGYNETTCGADLSRFIAWQPESPDSGEVIFWRSVYDVENVIVPTLEEALVAENQGANLTRIRDAIDGWRDTVAYIDEARENATEGVALLSSSEDAQDLGVSGLSRISWSGGGSIFSFTTSTSSATSRTFSRTITTTTEATVGFEAELTVLGASVGQEGSVTVGFEFATGRSETVEQTDSMDISFTLIDDTLGDHFVTEVLLDPVFGAPIFRTLSGQTMCPHEDGTVARQNVRLRVNDGIHASLTGVPPEDRRVLELEICNASPTNDDFSVLLSAPPASNPGSLMLETTGVSLSRSLEYGDLAVGCVTAQLSVMRGYTHFSFEDVVITAESDCDGDISDSVTLSVDYIIPCAAIEFGGYMEEENYWYVSTIQRHALPGAHDGEMLVVLFNPLSAGLPWDTHPRLEQVNLEYRKAKEERGAAGPWLPASVSWRDSTDSVIPPGTHDPYGFARLWWDVSGLPDDSYELRAVAQCEATSAGTASYDETTSDILPGHIDRRPPVLLTGFSEPADGVFEVGDDMSVTFDERILCSTFALRLEATGQGDDPAVDLIDERLLNVICGGATVQLRFGIALDLDRVVGREVTMVMNNVMDTSRNAVEGEFSWTFRVAQPDTRSTEVSVSGVRMLIGVNPCADGAESVECTAFRNELASEIAEILGVVAARIEVVDVEGQPEGAAAPPAEDGARRLQESAPVAEADTEVDASFVIHAGTGANDVPSWRLGNVFYESMVAGRAAPDTYLSRVAVEDAERLKSVMYVPTAGEGDEEAGLASDDVEVAMAAGAFSALFVGVIVAGVVVAVFMRRKRDKDVERERHAHHMILGSERHAGEEVAYVAEEARSLISKLEAVASMHGGMVGKSKYMKVVEDKEDGPEGAEESGVFL